MRISAWSSIAFLSFQLGAQYTALPLVEILSSPNGKYQASYLIPEQSKWTKIPLDPQKNPNIRRATFKSVGVQDVNGASIYPTMTIMIAEYPTNKINNSAIAQDAITHFGVTEIRRVEIADGVIVYCEKIYGGYSHRIIHTFRSKGNLGLQLICDSTDSAYSKVENEFIEWIKSVRLTEQ